MAVDHEVNLLPDKDRRAGDEAVKKAMQKPGARDIKMVVPTMQDKAQPKPTMMQRMFGKKKPAAVVAPVVTAPAKALPTPAPVKKEVPAKKHWWESKLGVKADKKEVKAPAMTMTAPKPAPMPAPKPSPSPVMAAPAPNVDPAPALAPKKEKAKSKLHEPQGDLSFSGPNVNLVPDYVKIEGGDRSWVLLVSIFVFVVAMWVIASGVTIARAKRAEVRVAEVQARLTQVNAAVKNFEAEKISAQALQKQFLLVETTLNNHVYWTPFLQKLEETTIPDVYYVSMTSARAGEVRLRAIAKTYTAAARQIRAFERATHFVQDVEIHEAVLEPQPDSALPVPVVSFDIQLTLSANALQIEAPEQAVTAP